MIVIGSDPHKSSHTFAAVDAATGQLRGTLTVAATGAGAERALRWARRVDGERCWAIEDCRHVSGRLERGLVARGERTVRVVPKLMAGARQGAREPGKSDPIDATAVARAALREGVDALPGAYLDERALEIRLWLDHHDDLVADRRDEQQRLRWHLHDLFEDLEIPAGALDRDIWLTRLTRRLAGRNPSARVRIARELIRSIRERTRRIRALTSEIAGLVADYAPQLLDEVGCGPLTAAKLIGELAGAQRFASDAQLARTAGVAPIPASSGRRQRYRLDRGGNRQLNLALHRLAINKARRCPHTAAYLARKQAEGKTRTEALRCLKRHLARRIWRLLRAGAPTPNQTNHTHMIKTNNNNNNNANTPEPALALT
jgi:transposase